MEIKEEEFKIISVWARSEHREGSCCDFCQRLACVGFGDGHRGALQHRPGGPTKEEGPSGRRVHSYTARKRRHRHRSSWGIVQILRH